VPAGLGRLPLGLLFAGALALRLVYFAEIAGSPLGELLLGDGRGYDAWAHRIAAGDWWGTEVFYQAPLYPYFLGLLYALAGASPWIARFAQALLGAASCLLVARAGARFFDARSGLAAGWLIALYPPAIFFDGEVQKASLSMFLMSAILALLAGLRDADRPPGRLLALGALVGLLALHRENALLLVPLLAAWFLAAAPAPPRRRLAAAGLLLAGALAVLMPVALRNRAIGGELLLTTSQLGPNFYIGNNPTADGRYHPLRPGRGSPRYEREDATALAEAAVGRALSPAEVSRHWLARALAFARSEPAAWLRLQARKWRLVWHAREIVDTTSLEAAADFSALLRSLARCHHFGVLVPLAAAGIWLARRRWRELGVLYLLVVTWAAATALFYVFARYRYPLVPMLALFAGAGLVTAAAAIRARHPLRLLPAAAIAAVVALVVNRPLDARDPRAVTYASLGQALDEAGRAAEGARLLERAVTLSPAFAEAHRALGHLRLRGGDLDGADAAYRRAVELDPGDASAWNNLGVVAGQRGRLAEALAHFRRAVAADARYAPGLFNLARTLAGTADRDAAREAFRRYLDLVPGDGEAEAYLRALDRAGDRSDAAPGAAPPRAPAVR